MKVKKYKIENKNFYICIFEENDWEKTNEYEKLFKKINHKFYGDPNNWLVEKSQIYSGNFEEIATEKKELCFDDFFFNLFGKSIEEVEKEEKKRREKLIEEKNKFKFEDNKIYFEDKEIGEYIDISGFDNSFGEGDPEENWIPGYREFSLFSTISKDIIEKFKKYFSIYREIKIIKK